LQIHAARTGPKGVRFQKVGKWESAKNCHPPFLCRVLHYAGYRPGTPRPQYLTNTASERYFLGGHAFHDPANSIHGMMASAFLVGMASNQPIWRVRRLASSGEILAWRLVALNQVLGSVAVVADRMNARADKEDCGWWMRILVCVSCLGWVKAGEYGGMGQKPVPLFRRYQW
jgi:hypothetical protein